MIASGLYRRSLPSPPSIDFSSPQGKQLFAEAFQNGTMEGFFKLISHFQTQSEPTYCGLASLAMVLNALSIDPCRKWKGPWRWFDETMLDCCKSLDKVRVEGISFRNVVCMAHCAGANVKAFRTNQSTIDEFRKSVVACSSSEDCHLISLYDRRVLKQTGGGHFSPIGGYHPKSDMVLILDVARFKYPPHWVRLSVLWEAMDTIIKGTGSHRGFLLVSRHQRPLSGIHTQSCIDDNWMRIAKYLTGDAPLLLSSDNMKDLKDVISTIFSSLPPDFVEFTKNVAEVHRKEDGAENDPNHPKVVKLVRNTSLYKHVKNAWSSEDCSCKIGQASGSCGAGKLNSEKIAGNSIDAEEMGREASNSNSFVSCCCCSMQRASNEDLTELLLALPHETWSALKDDTVLKEISSLVSIECLPSLLRDEVLHIRGQLLVLKRCHHDRKRGRSNT